MPDDRMIEEDYRPRLLDLFCGAGGAAMGYHRAGFEVIGIDIEPQPHYPFEFHQADALDWLDNAEDLFERFDAIHASPPCQSYSSLNRLNVILGNPSRKPELVDAMRPLLELAGLPWVMENVPGSTIKTSLVLCGSMFDLRVRRHRLFECSHLIFAPGPCQHRGHDFIGVYSDHPRVTKYRQPDGYERAQIAGTLAEGQAAMGMEWSDWQGLREAIPPAYTEWIGARLMEHIKVVA